MYPEHYLESVPIRMATPRAVHDRLKDRRNQEFRRAPTTFLGDFQHKP